MYANVCGSHHKPMFAKELPVCRSLVTKVIHVCLQIHNNPVGITLFSLFMATYIFYFYVRIRYTLFGGYFGYSLFILIVELAASTNMVCVPLLLKGCFCLSQALKCSCLAIHAPIPVAQDHDMNPDTAYKSLWH